VGASYRFLDVIEPPPAVKEGASAKAVELYRPNIDVLTRTDPPFAKVVEERSSLRTHGDPPITDRQLGEFLFRSARVRGVARSERLEISNRPYPSGGALYSLELYTLINACRGIEPGLYHYDPLHHELRLASAPTPLTAALSCDARAATGGEREPQILIIMSARFQRVLWKYQSLAYALILKDVGVVMQTMNLVATAMDLAACAVGDGNSELFAGAAGTEYHVETSVGELILGSRAHQEEAPYMGVSFVDNTG
jgi:SagB-type dehydrogenase family enzyme